MHFYSLRLRHPASNRISRNVNAQRILLKRLADWSNGFISLLSIDVTFVICKSLRRLCMLPGITRVEFVRTKTTKILGCAHMPSCAHAEWAIWVNMILAQQVSVGTLTLIEPWAPRPAETRRFWGRGRWFRLSKSNRGQAWAERRFG